MCKPDLGEEGLALVQHAPEFTASPTGLSWSTPALATKEKVPPEDDTLSLVGEEGLEPSRLLVTAF